MPTIRKDMNRFAALSIFVVAAMGAVFAFGSGDDHAKPAAKATAKKEAYVAPKDALRRLEEGNKLFVEGASMRPRQSAERRAEVAKKQFPFAVVVTCSDSRVCPEFIFDQGLGDLFVIRVAGNTIDDVALGSIEYAVEHLGSRLIVVMGHERCGAVDAAMKGGELPGHIKDLVVPIKAAVDATKGISGDTLDAAVRFNAHFVADSLRVRESLIKDLIAKSEVKVVGARYDLESGAVDFLD